MDAVIGGIRWVHIVLGFVGLVAWWVPVLTKKGGERHKLFGKIFAFCAYFVAGSAMLTPPIRIGRALADGASITENPEGFGFLIFLAYLGLVTFALTRHAVQTVRTRRDPDSIRTPFHIALGIAPTAGSVVVVASALLLWSSISIIMLLLSPLGLFISADILKYIYRRETARRAWFYAHMGAMLGAGIAFHTAFLVFGSRLFVSPDILGPLNWLPWVLPGMIGGMIGGFGGRYWEKQYRQKFGDLVGPGSDGDGDGPGGSVPAGGPMPGAA